MRDQGGRTSCVHLLEWTRDPEYHRDPGRRGPPIELSLQPLVRALSVAVPDVEVQGALRDRASEVLLVERRKAWEARKVQELERYLREDALRGGPSVSLRSRQPKESVVETQELFVAQHARVLGHRLALRPELLGVGVVVGLHLPAGGGDLDEAVGAHVYGGPIAVHLVHAARHAHICRGDVHLPAGLDNLLAAQAKSLLNAILAAFEAVEAELLLLLHEPRLQH
mmetsp:Transcript_114887/g.357910  ORF Transcript_114887/g.357910 Transcript_114887/m.357910 type:complete len:225 (+) Transcript_114887:2197-2871(+)